MKKISKIVLLGLITLMAMTSVVTPMFVSAKENETTTVNNYAIFDWVSHTDFINNGKYAAGTISFVNLDGRTMNISLLGSGSSPRPTSTKELLGGGYSVSPGNREHEVYMGNFSSNKGGLIIDELNIGLYAEYQDGSYAPLQVYKNGYWSDVSAGWSGYHCGSDGHACNASDVMHRSTPTPTNPVITLRNLDTSYDSLLFRFDSPSRIKKYYFTYLQVTKYKTWDIVGWTTDPNDPLTGYSSTAKVDKSVVKKYTQTTTVGDFNPKFSKLENSDTTPKWVNSVNSSFNAGLKGLFEYPETETGGDTKWDIGRNKEQTTDGKTPAETSPGGTFVREHFMREGNGGFDLHGAQNISKWSCSGGSCSVISKNDKGQKAIHRYGAVHWTNQNKGQHSSSNPNGWYSESGNGGWCTHVNAPNGKCYKYGGYGSNHNTVWDGGYKLFTQEGDGKYKVLETTYYYQKYADLLGNVPVGGQRVVGSDAFSKVTNKDGTPSANPVKGDDIASIINVYGEGVFKLIASVNASLDKPTVKNVESEFFYIDKTAPRISFDQSDNQKWYTNTDLPVITARVSDNLSGLNTLKVIRYKSKDGVNWVSDGNYETVYDFGERNKNVRKDAIANKDVKINLSATTGYMYYRAKVMATDVAGNSYDTLSPIYKYDAYPLLSYTLKPVRFYNEANKQLNWTNRDVEVTFNVSDTESGLSKLQITRGNQYGSNVVAEVKSWPQRIVNNAGFLVGSDFTDTVRYMQSTRVTENDNMYVHVVDKNGHVTTKPYIVDHIDKEAPKINWGNIDTNTWFTDRLPDILAKATDNLSGVDLGNVRRYKSTNGKTWELMTTENNQVIWDGYTQGANFDNPKRDDLSTDLTIHMKAEKGYMFYKVEVDLTDVAGNKATYTSPVMKYDKIPQISYTHEPPRLKPDGTINWTNKDVTVNITLSDDEAGVQAVCLATGTTWNSCTHVIKEWRKDNLHEDLNVNASFIEDNRVVKQDGLYLVVIDKVGHTNSTPYITDHIDKVPPVINITPNGYGPDKGPVDVTITVDDVPMKPDGGKSDVDKWEYCTSNDNGANWECKENIPGKQDHITIDKPGHTIIKVVVTDKAGNKTETTSKEFIIVGNPPTLIARTDYWWVDETSDINEILKNAEAYSEVDGNISNQIKISRITYQDGDVIDYPKNFRTDKAQSFVTEFEVTDSNGFTTRGSQIYQVLEPMTVKPGTDSGKDEMYDNVSIYQRYIDEYKIALEEHSYWNTKYEYQEALDRALMNSNAIDKATITRNR